MRIVIFPEKTIFKYLEKNKKNTIEVFKGLHNYNNLFIVVMVKGIQNFYSRTYVAGLKFKSFHLQVSELAGKDLSVRDLKEAVMAVSNIKHSRVTLISHNHDDALVANKLDINFILLGTPKKRSKVVISDVIKDFSLLPNILGLS